MTTMDFILGVTLVATGVSGFFAALGWATDRHRPRHH